MIGRGGLLCAGSCPQSPHLLELAEPGPQTASPGRMSGAQPPERPPAALWGTLAPSQMGAGKALECSSVGCGSPSTALTAEPHHPVYVCSGGLFRCGDLLVVVVVVEKRLDYTRKFGSSYTYIQMHNCISCSF